MILTDIGEIGVNCDGQRYILRPSLFAMTQLGSPEEIVRVYASVMHEHEHADQLEDALAVIFACANEGDNVEWVSDVFGHMDLVKNGADLEYINGKAATSDILPIARCLMKHGIVGDYPPLPVPANKDKEYVSGFNARDHVSLATAHLGVQSRDAWNMTMTELVGGMRAKFPQAEIEAKKEAAKYPSENDMKMLMDYHNSIGGQ